MKRWLVDADFRSMPWANGKGVTVELARADLDGMMQWRLSRASVVENGPFSIFPGVDRVLTVLTGPGFDLQGPGIDLQARPFAPVAFAGDISVSAVGVTAPSDDFNVMTARRLGPVEVRVISGAVRIEGGRLVAVYWPEAARLLLTDEGHDLGPTDLAIAVNLPHEA